MTRTATVPVAGKLPRAAFAFSAWVLVWATNAFASTHTSAEAFAPLSVARPRMKITTPRPQHAVRYGAEDERSSSERRNSAKYTAPQRSDDSKRTLYDILHCSPDATREELKTQYVALARESHPDAIRGRPDATNDPDRPDFNEVARAWKLLSDPRERKKYDRSLRAERFTEDVEHLATHVAETAVPRVRKMLDEFAAPLVRRTAVTAVAGFEAATKDAIRKGGDEAVGRVSVDLGHAIASAVRASQQAGRAIDRMELVEKSRQLDARAEEEEALADSLKKELASVVEERLRIALRTPNSDLSSMEALKILDGFNTVDSVSVVESLVLLKKTLKVEIAALEEAERQYYEKYDTKITAEREYAEQRRALRMAEKNAEAAVVAERRAQEALNAARDLMDSSRRAVLKCGESAAAMEVALERTSKDVDLTKKRLQKRQERVRKALRRKEEAARVQNGGGARGAVWRFGENLELLQETQVQFQQSRLPFNSTDGTNYFDMEDVATAVADLGCDAEVADADDEEQIKANLEKLLELRKAERMLTAETTRLDSRAIRLQSQAQKLKDRANGMTGDNPISTQGLHP